MTAEEIDEFLRALDKIGREQARQKRDQRSTARSPGTRTRRR